jgi:hypothetical protein
VRHHNTGKLLGGGGGQASSSTNEIRVNPSTPDMRHYGRWLCQDEGWEDEAREGDGEGVGGEEGWVGVKELDMVDCGVGGEKGGDRLRGGEVVSVSVVVHSDGHGRHCRLAIGEEKECDWEHPHCHNSCWFGFDL